MPRNRRSGGSGVRPTLTLDTEHLPEKEAVGPQKGRSEGVIRVLPQSYIVDLLSHEGYHPRLSIAGLQA